jgi:hypothetical protein
VHSLEEEEGEELELQEEEEEKHEEEEEEEEQHEGEARHYEDEVVGGDRSASGSASSHQYRTHHLIHPPVAPHEDNRVAIIPSGDV